MLTKKIGLRAFADAGRTQQNESPGAHRFWGSRANCRRTFDPGSRGIRGPSHGLLRRPVRVQWTASHKPAPLA